MTDAVLWCGLCGAFIQGQEGQCEQCGAITTVTMTERAQAYVAEREREIAAFERWWAGLTPEQQERERRKAQEGG